MKIQTKNEKKNFYFCTFRLSVLGGLFLDGDKGEIRLEGKIKI